MIMGLPLSESERITFRWTPESTWAVDDPGGSPYNFAATPVSTETHADVLVPAAVEFSARLASSSGESIGDFDNSRAIITILDEDYELVRTADLVILGGNAYEIEFVAPPLGLFEVTVYQLYCVARDES